MKQIYKSPEMREITVKLKRVVMNSFGAGMEPIGSTDYMEDPIEKSEQLW